MHPTRYWRLHPFSVYLPFISFSAVRSITALKQAKYFKYNSFLFYSSSFARSVYRLCKQLKTDLKRFVYPFEHLSVQMADTILQPAFVDRAQLFQQYY